MEDKNVSQMTTEQLEQLLKAKKEKERENKQKREDAYLTLRDDFIDEIEKKALEIITKTKEFHQWLIQEERAFHQVQIEHGKLRKNAIDGYSLSNENFKVVIGSITNHEYDERANQAAARMMEFIEEWLAKRGLTKEDTMYSLVVSLLERNKKGDFDKSRLDTLKQQQTKINSPVFDEILEQFEVAKQKGSRKRSFKFLLKNRETMQWVELQPSFNRL